MGSDFSFTEEEKSIKTMQMRMETPIFYKTPKTEWIVALLAASMECYDSFV